MSKSLRKREFKNKKPWTVDTDAALKLPQPLALEMRHSSDSKSKRSRRNSGRSRRPSVRKRRVTDKPNIFDNVDLKVSDNDTRDVQIQKMMMQHF